MIKLVCYGSKVLHLKEAYHSYVGEKSFTTIKVITANKIDGHDLSDLQVDLHIIKSIYNDPITLSLKPNAEISEAEVILEDKYTVYEGVIGFYLQFNKIMEDSGKKIIGKTNSVFIDVLDNAKVEKKEESNNTNNSFPGFSSQGSSGKDGKDGKDGKNGVTYTPSISAEGILSWTNDGGLPNPTPIKVIGKDGMNGTNGADGKNGQDYILTEADKQDIAQIASENIKEKDPTVSEWAKQPNKPTYSSDEVGAVPKTRKIADIDLKDDISIDEMRNALRITDNKAIIRIDDIDYLHQLETYDFEHGYIYEFRAGVKVGDDYVLAGYFIAITVILADGLNLYCINVHNGDAILVHPKNGEFTNLSNSIIVDSELDANSSNAVSNKAVFTALENKADKSYVDNIVDSINSALDELHAYAQGLITGGDEV